MSVVVKPIFPSDGNFINLAGRLFKERKLNSPTRDLHIYLFRLRFFIQLKEEFVAFLIFPIIPDNGHGVL